jgi:hypothetical protein
LIWAAIALGALLVAAAVPSPLRDPALAALLFLLVLSPLIAIGYGIAHWDRARFGTWFGLVPLAIVYLGWFELRYGVSARIARHALLRDEVRPRPK